MLHGGLVVVGTSEARRSSSNGRKSSLWTAAWMTASTRWLRGIKAGFVARMADRRSAGLCGSSARRRRQRSAHPSKLAGSMKSSPTG